VMCPSGPSVTADSITGPNRSGSPLAARAITLYSSLFGQNPRCNGQQAVETGRGCCGSQGGKAPQPPAAPLVDRDGVDLAHASATTTSASSKPDGMAALRACAR